jgi:hypothetical protein
MLLKQGFELGFVAPLETMLLWYHTVVSAVAYILEPPLRSMVQFVGGFLPWHIELQPTWKHLAAVALAWTAAIGRIMFAVVRKGETAGLWKTILQYVVLGQVGALLLGIISRTPGALFWGTIDATSMDASDPRYAALYALETFLVIFIGGTVVLIPTICVASFQGYRRAREALQIEGLPPVEARAIAWSGTQWFATKCLVAWFGPVICVVVFVATSAGLGLAGIK